VPLSHDAFLEHQVNAVTFSATAMDVVRRLLRGEQVRQPESGLSKREWDEVCLVLGLKSNQPSRPPEATITQR
jgi:thymidylate synthase (FAD)